jgi:hypothetical protein
MRRLNWHFDMVSMLCLLLFILPYYHSYVALAARMQPLRASLGAACLLAAGLFAFWHLGGVVPGIPRGHTRLLTMLEVRVVQRPAAGVRHTSSSCLLASFAAACPASPLAACVLRLPIPASPP